VQFTIEKHPLTTEYSHRPEVDGDRSTFTIEALSSDEAIHQFVSDEESELVSHVRPLTGRESIATVKKNDAMYMLRIYAN
jgi:hypothetical protein